MPGYPHKASYFVTKFLVAAIEPEINCTDDSNFLCDGVCTQSTKLKEDIVVAFDRGNVGWKMVYNFMGMEEKT